MTTWALIPCSKAKAAEPCAAGEMYKPSEGFQMAWEVAEKTGAQILILSAKYGAIWPYQVIEPYDQSLIRARVKERERWASEVITQLGLTWPNDGKAVIRAGDQVVSFLPRAYGEILHRVLRENGVQVDEPMKGLKPFQRRAWLRQRLREVS